MSESTHRPGSIALVVPGALLKGRYRLERPIGRGGMAAVWLAEDTVLERPVAVKVLSDTIASDPEFVARFRREARIVAGLWHPSLIGVYDFAEGGERPYLVMEYLPGGSLAAVVPEKGRIDADGLARQLLGAVAHIHDAGIIHRDIKPQNLLFGSQGEVKLIDFGIALPPDATAITRTGHLLGTARFIAPEVMRGAPASERSDLYSCGIVLRDCGGEEGTPLLRVLVERLCHADPVRRPPSALAALREIEANPKQLDAPTEQFELGPQPARPRLTLSRHRLAALLGILAAALAVTLVVATNEGGEPADAGSATAQQGRANTGAEKSGDGGSAAGEASAAATSAPQLAPSGEDPALGAALNEEGFALIGAGRYADAVQLLEQAVRAFPPGTEDLNYAYALFNLGNALRLAGRPDEAVPILEQRLTIPNQTAEVRQELQAAQREAAL